MTAGLASASGCTVADAMLTIPRTHSIAVTVGEVASFFADDHVHAALIVGPTGRLAAVVERGDLAAGAVPGTPAVRFGRLDGRTILAGTGLAEARQGMIESGRRRVAVIDPGGLLLGLLCLKASRTGFCSDQDVLARRGCLLDFDGG